MFSGMATRTRQPGYYELPPGRSLGSRYEVVEFLGCGWEGEVYKVVEVRTGIERAAKLFYPQRNPRGRALLRYAKKLTKLRHVPIIIQYHHQDTTKVHGEVVEFLVSEYVPGELLSAFQAHQPGKRMKSFEALHVLHTLAAGIAPIHLAGEYHGDLHTDNVIIRRRGIGFEVKLMDFLDLGRPSREKIRDDVVDLVNMLHEIIGGRAWYNKSGPEIKQIVCGQKRSLILKKFRTAADLASALLNLDWAR